jgi:N-acetylmuramoyl-L-alanine amidase
LGALFVGAPSAAGCAADPPPAAPPAGPTDRERAQALLDPNATLPTRAETVAIADAVAIASAKEGKTIKGASLARLAGDLRARLWRVDQSAADGREALELYAAAAGATAGAEAGCDADRKRALLAGEIARDAGVTYRELYITARRQAVLLARVGGEKPPARSACLAAIDSAIAHAVAYRPSSEMMRALESEGNAAAELALRSAGGAGIGASAGDAGSAAPLSALAASGAADPPSASLSSKDGDVVVSPSEQAAAGPVKILSIDRHGSDKAARVVIRLSGPATFNVGALAADRAAGKDDRVFIDIARASARGVARETEVGGVLRRVRVGAQEAGTRVVLDVAADLHRRVFYFPDPFRIVIDVSTRAPLLKERLSESGKREIRRVVLDPGHGGGDTGAVGPTGLREKDVTLDIAHRAAPLLAHELQIDTLLTRDSDAYVSLDLRAARANAFHADLFVSIHCNASEDGLARGVQTFYLDEVREAESSAARLAARENLLRAQGQAAPSGSLRHAEEADAEAEAEIASILSSLRVGAMATRSRHVADLLQRSTLASLAPRYPDTRDQGVRTAGFYVLAGADMPAVLFETAFISNPVDESRLATADYRQKLADAIVNAIRAYREGK